MQNIYFLRWKVHRLFLDGKLRFWEVLLVTINNNINVNQYEVPLCQIKSFYSTFKLSQQSFCLTHVLTPKYSIYFCWVRFLVLLQYSTIEPTTETIFCWMLIFSFHCQSDASFFCQNNLPIYQNLFTGWPLWKDKVDTWGNKTCLFMFTTNTNTKRKHNYLLEQVIENQGKHLLSRQLSK